MGKWFRCPVCGRLCPERNVDKDFPLEAFNQIGLGRAKGFRYDRIADINIVERIKNKIKALYERYFKIEISVLDFTLIKSRSMDSLKLADWEVVSVG